MIEGLRENIDILRMQGRIWKLFVFGFVLSELRMLTFAPGSWLQAGGLLGIQNLAFGNFDCADAVLGPLLVLYLQKMIE